jgi:putative nucleotidyltransferase with HDIG domain
VNSDPVIDVSELRIGLYVYLDLRWFEHPFALGHFKIKTEEQIRTIRGLGLKRVRYSPDLSDREGPEETAPPANQPARDEVSPIIAQALAAKKVMIERIRVQRDAAARIENAFIVTASTIREVEKNILTKPAETVKSANQLVNQISESILSAPELAIHVMGDMAGGEELYFHSLNVTMLSLMLARDLGVPQEAVTALGMGALFHDVGRSEIPSRILLKVESLTQAEQHLYEQHCDYGVTLGKRLGFSPAVLAVIHQHHEMFDGSGYPQHLKGDSINLLARIVGLANYYDELCNPVNIANALMPHEALSLMFAKLRGKFDPRLLQLLIRRLGVYPPGTVVQLSNGAMAMVATVNTSQPMKPILVVYDESVPRDEAILIDLSQDSDLNIAKAIKPALVPRHIYNYLSPRKRVSYYFDASQGPDGSKK